MLMCIFLSKQIIVSQVCKSILWNHIIPLKLELGELYALDMEFSLKFLNQMYWKQKKYLQIVGFCLKQYDLILIRVHRGQNMGTIT